MFRNEDFDPLIKILKFQIIFHLCKLLGKRFKVLQLFCLFLLFLYPVMAGC